MSEVPIIGRDELVARVAATLDQTQQTSRRSDFNHATVPTSSPAYCLILGAGFSRGVVPLVNELMHRTIGDYYYPDQDQASIPRGWRNQQKNSARFWAQFNAAADAAGLPTVELDARGLPEDASAAYQYLFCYEGANVLFAATEPKAGERFVKGFLQYVLDPGSEHGYGSTGRNRLNAAHVYLAALLEAQQSGRGWRRRPFCRTILTTNFDTLLQNALQMVNLLYRLTDEPERGFDAAAFSGPEGSIRLVYVHGSILCYNPASTVDEVSDLAKRNVGALGGVLQSHDVIAIGYSGWKDGLMAALQCEANGHAVYWCDVKDEPSASVRNLLSKRGSGSAYVHLAKDEGADDLMRAMYDALVPADAREDPIRRYQQWSALGSGR